VWGVWTEEERGVMRGVKRVVEEELTMIEECLGVDGNTVDPRSRLLVPAAGWWKLPRFFSWVIPARLAGMSTPKCREDIEALRLLGVTRVVTLTAEQPLPREWFVRGIANTLIPVANYFPPTEQQMDHAIRIIVEERRTLVHCGGGKGRAGTVLACYLALYGFLLPEPGMAPKMEARKAVELLRIMRPGSVETEKQEQFVERYVSLAWKRYGQSQPLYGNGGEVNEPAGLPLEITGDIADADVIVLIGLQGSGKSTFSKMAQLRNPSVIIVSPDDVVAENHQAIGSASAARSCEGMMGRFRRSPPEHHHPRRQLILDRCNPTAEERKRWTSLLTTPAKIIAVWFHYDADLCRARVENRSLHPSLPPWRAKTAIDSVAKQLQPPSLSEDFSGIAIVRGIDSARDLANQLFGPVGMQKFIRTRHLLDLGGATRDDLVVPPDELARHFGSRQHVIVEEKIDGANLGISLGDSGQLQVQNRSHYVSSNDQAQFSLLPAWLDGKREALLEILRAEEGLQERYVLYGEWMVATHSIEYTHLPDWFVAFDLYDRVESRFFSRAELRARLEGTGIMQVPLLYEGVLDGEDTLLGFLERKSRFSPEVRVEGVVVRFPGGERGKVVRADFVAGNVHWSKHTLRKNRVWIE
jgi:atypical dual specificity phosphatase